MILAAMAVATVSQASLDIAESARAARWARVRALIADTILFTIILSIANAVYGLTTVTWGSPIPIGGSGWAFFGTQTSISWGWASLIYVAYFASWEALFGATPGKLIVGIRVVGLDDRPITLAAAVIRNVLRLIDALPILYLVGGFFVMRTKTSQRLGDIAAGTMVVLKRDAPTKRTTRRAKTAFFASLAALVLFTGGFAYFGRPPLEIQGLYNTHRLMDLESYALGQPTWGAGTVTYPITGRTPTASCTGWIQLDWYWVQGWQPANAEMSCPPS